MKGIKAAGLKITRKEKHKKNVRLQNKVRRDEGSRDCYRVNRADPDSLFSDPLKPSLN